MPKIITVAHQKGGVGKTTLSLFLYQHMTMYGANCAVIDTDPQKSIKVLYETLGSNDNWGTLNLIDPDDYSWDQIVKLDYDIIIVDTPPAYVDIIDKVLKYADFVLVPCKASPLDLLAIRETVSQVEAAQKINPNLKAGIVLNQVIFRSSFTEEAKNVLKQSHSLPVLKTVIHNRADIARFLTKSISVHNEKNRKVDEEVSLLINEIVEMLRS